MCNYYLFFILAVNAYVLPTKSESIQADILENGPVEAAMVVYEDFISYQSGELFRKKHAILMYNKTCILLYDLSLIHI